MVVNPSRRLYDLTLFPPSGGSIGLMLYRGEPDKRGVAKAISRYGPATDAEQAIIRDVPVTMADFSGGFGYSQRSDQAQNTYAWGEGVCCRNPRVVVPAGELVLQANLGVVGKIATSIEFNGFVFWGTDNGTIYRSAGGNGTPSFVVTIGGAGTQFKSSALFMGDAYLGGTGELVRINTAGSVTSLAGISRPYIATLYTVTADNVGANRLIGSESVTGSNVKYTSADPSVAGNWSSSITIGDNTHPVAGVVASNRHAYFLKRSGIHDLDELGYSPNLTPYWNQTLDTTVVPIGIVQDGYLYATQGRRGLERLNLSQGPIRRDTPEWCHPGFGISNETPIQGYPTAIVNDQGWLCVAIFNPINGKSYIMYGKDRRYLGIDGPGPILWHGAEAVISPTTGGNTSVQVTNMRVVVPTSGNPLLWIAVQEQTGQQVKLYTLDLPKAASPLSDIFQGGAHRFATTGTMYLTAQDWGQEYSMLLKHVWGYDVRMDNGLQGSRDIDIYAQDAGGNYGLEGTAYVSPLQSFGVPDNIPITTEGHSIGIRLDIQSQATNAPIFRGIQIRAAMMFSQDEYIPYEVEYGEGVPLRLPGMTDPQNVGEVHDLLIAMQGTTITPFPAVDELGRSITVRMAQGIEFERTEGSMYGQFRERARFLIRVMQ